MAGSTASIRQKPVEAQGDTALLQPHERIVAVARDMFCRDGIHATGIDRILAAASASKMTLYSRFGSKEALLREVLRVEGAEWREAFVAAVEAAAADAPGRLLAIVPTLGGWFNGGRFYGCAFMNAIAEHTKGEPWLRELAVEHQTLVAGFLERLATEAGYSDPALLARQIMLLIDGTTAALLVTGDAGVLAVAERNFRAVLAIA